MLKKSAGILSGGIPADMHIVQGTGQPIATACLNFLSVNAKSPIGLYLILGIQPHIPLDQWTLEINGEVENPYTLTWKDFMDLPQVKDVSDFHCVTSWSRMDNQWEGVRFKTLAEKAGLKPSAKFVYITGHDGYSTNLKLEECLDDDVLIVHHWNGIPLPREHGGPARMITPRKYAWKGSKWIKEIIFLDQDQLGFWEVRGYSNTAEPWFNDRYSE